MAVGSMLSKCNVFNTIFISVKNNQRAVFADYSCYLEIFPSLAVLLSIQLGAVSFLLLILGLSLMSPVIG